MTWVSHSTASKVLFPAPAYGQGGRYTGGWKLKGSRVEPSSPAQPPNETTMTCSTLLRAIPSLHSPFRPWWCHLQTEQEYRRLIENYLNKGEIGVAVAQRKPWQVNSDGSGDRRWSNYGASSPAARRYKALLSILAQPRPPLQNWWPTSYLAPASIKNHHKYLSWIAGHQKLVHDQLSAVLRAKERGGSSAADWLWKGFFLDWGGGTGGVGRKLPVWSR